jgi:hypothetical protein
MVFVAALFIAPSQSVLIVPRVAAAFAARPSHRIQLVLMLIQGKLKNY